VVHIRVPIGQVGEPASKGVIPVSGGAIQLRVSIEEDRLRALVLRPWEPDTLPTSWKRAVAYGPWPIAVWSFGPQAAVLLRSKALDRRFHPFLSWNISLHS
jgi:hypothetical protein